MNRYTLNENELSKIQNIEIDVLKEVDAICRKHDIPYSLGYGTLIGCIRHKGFIPWDDDIDICVFRKDMEKFKKACQEELSDKYFYQSHDTDKEYCYLWDKIRVNDTLFKETFLGKYNMHHGMFIDVFPIDNISDSKFQYMRQYYAFRFYKTGLMVKYVDHKARSGKKRIFAEILRIAYAPFSREFLYKQSVKHMTKYSDKKTKRSINFAGARHINTFFPRRYYEQLMEKEFAGNQFFVPKKYHQMLTKFYGNYMEFPPVEDRKTVHDLLALKFPGEDVK